MSCEHGACCQTGVGTVDHSYHSQRLQCIQILHGCFGVLQRLVGDIAEGLDSVHVKILIQADGSHHLGHKRLHLLDRERLDEPLNEQCRRNGLCTLLLFLRL